MRDVFSIWRKNENHDLLRKSIWAKGRYSCSTIFIHHGTRFVYGTLTYTLVPPLSARFAMTESKKENHVSQV